MRAHAKSVNTASPKGKVTRYEVLPGAFRVRTDFFDGREKTITWMGLSGRKVDTIPPWMHDKIDDDGVVYIHEGEKPAEAGRKLGLRNSVGTFGTGATPTPAALSFCRDRDVVLLADAHTVGRAHMRKVAANLRGIARTVKMTEFPDVPEGGDAVDFLELHAADAARLAVEVVQSAVEDDDVVDDHDDVESHNDVGGQNPSDVRPGKEITGLYRVLNFVHSGKKTCRLSKNGKIITVALGWHAGKSNSAWPGNAQLHAETGLCMGSVSTAIQEACGPLGIFTKQRRGPGATCLYTLKPENPGFNDSDIKTPENSYTEQSKEQGNGLPPRKKGGEAGAEAGGKAGSPSNRDSREPGDQRTRFDCSDRSSVSQTRSAPPGGTERSTGWVGI